MKQRWFAVEWEDKDVESGEWDSETGEFSWCRSVNEDQLEYMKCVGNNCYVQFQDKVSVGEADSAFQGQGMVNIKCCTKAFVDKVKGGHTHGQIRSSGAPVSSKIKKIAFYDHFEHEHQEEESFEDFPVNITAKGSRSYLIQLSPHSQIDTCKTFKVDKDVELSKCSRQIVYVYLKKYTTLETVRKWYGSAGTTIMICSKKYCEGFFSTRPHDTHDDFSACTNHFQGMTM
jgi:hypothetical protein